MRQYLTIKDLKQAMACPGGRRRFLITFPTGRAALTKRNCEKFVFRGKRITIHTYGNARQLCFYVLVVLIRKDLVTMKQRARWKKERMDIEYATELSVRERSQQLIDSLIKCFNIRWG